MSVYSPIIPNHSESEFLEEINSSQSTSVSENIISIGSYPSSTVSNASIMVPSGKAVTGLDLTIEGHSLPNHVSYSIETDSDFQKPNMLSDITAENNQLKIESIPSSVAASFTLPSTAGSLNTATSCSATYSYYSSTQGQEFTYNHQIGSIYMEYTSSSWGSETCIEYKSPSSTNFILWKDYGQISSSTTYNSKTQSPPVIFSSYGNYAFRIWDSFGDGSNGGTLDIIQEEISNSQGSWQSNPISLSSLGINEEMAFGPLSIDAKIPSGSKLTMSIIDSVTNMSIPGFEGIEQNYFDLGIIDWELYPEIAVRLELTASSAGDSPIIYGLHFEGKIVDSFETDVSSDWNLQSCTWSSGQISGSGSAISPEYVSRSGFSILNTNSIITGGGMIEYSLDSGQTWNDFDIQQTAKLDRPYHSVKFKISGNNNWVLDQFSVDLLRSSVAEGVEIDLQADGIPEWSMNYNGAGKLGFQNRFIDNSLSISKQSLKESAASFDFLLPKSGVDSLEFFVSSEINFQSPYFVIDINSQNIISRNLPDISNIRNVELTNSELNQLNNALSESNSHIESNGLSMSKVTIKLGSSNNEPIITILGLKSLYEPEINLLFDSDSVLLKQINNLLNDITSIQSTKEVKIPVRMKGTGSIKFTINSLSTIQSITPVSISIANVSKTFTPSINWIDVNTTFDFGNFGILNPESYVKQNSWSIELNLIGNYDSSKLSCSTAIMPISGQGVNNCINSGVELIWSDLGTSGSISMSDSSTLLHVNHRFKFPIEWDDQDYLVVSVNLISPNGPMLPISESFGLGNYQGVENDVEVKDWSVVGLNGIGSDIEYPYLKKGEQVTVEVYLGFEGEELTYPRTGHVLTRLLVEGNEFGSSTIVNNGIVSIPWVVPSVGDGVNLEVDVQPLKSQDVSYAVPRSADFGFDSVSPQLLNMNIDEYDHFESSPSKLLEFSITDSPVLPSKAEIILWSSWMNDFNQNGQVDVGEFNSFNMQKPTDMNATNGIYSYDLDTSMANDGSYVIGWLIVADSAGNLMKDSGNISSPLFNLLVSDDGPPQLGNSDLIWEYGIMPWLHPGENITIDIPVWDKNGITDIADIKFDLSSNQPDSSTISWDRQNNFCSSSTQFIEIISCSMNSDDNSSLFANYGKFRIEFKLKWGFDQDDNIIRTPSLVLTDLKGQTTSVVLSDLNWRYSGEMEIDRSSISYQISGDNSSNLGAWVKANSSITISGSINWLKSDRKVEQDLQLVYRLGQEDWVVDYVNGQFNGSITSPPNAGNYIISITLIYAPNGASIVEPESPLLWFVVDKESPTIKMINSPIPGELIKESNWADLQIQLTLSEDKYLDEESIYLYWEVHPSEFGFSSTSIASGSGLVTILGGMPYGNSIKSIYDIDLESAISDEDRTKSLELRIWVNGSDMAGNNFSQVSDLTYTPFEVWQLEQQLPEYEFLQPLISNSKNVVVGEAIDLSVVIKNVGKSDGVAQLRVERVESNGARTIIHTQDVMVQSGNSGNFNHRWIPDRSGLMWIEFVILDGGPTTQTETFYADSGESEGFFSGIAEINPVLLITIFILMSSLIGLLIFGLRTTPNNSNQQRLPSNKNYQRVGKQMPPQTQQQYYSNQQSAVSPGDNPYQ